MLAVHRQCLPTVLVIMCITTLRFPLTAFFLNSGVQLWSVAMYHNMWDSDAARCDIFVYVGIVRLLFCTSWIEEKSMAC